MHRWLIICALGAALLLGGCGSSQGGRWPAPVFNLKLGILTTPQSPFEAGDELQFKISWTDGRAPYTVNWDFDEGTDPPVLTTVTDALMHTAEVVAVNDTEAAVAYGGSVTITDMDNSVVTSTFSFTVEPLS